MPCHPHGQDGLAVFPDEAYNCIRDFFSCHSHCTMFGEVSSLVDVTASVIQGFSLCPASYIAANHII